MKSINTIIEYFKWLFTPQFYDEYDHILVFIDKYDLSILDDFSIELADGIKEAKEDWASELLSEIKFKCEWDFYSSNQSGEFKLPYKDLFNLLYNNKAYNMEKFSEMMELDFNNRDEDYEEDEMWQDETDAGNNISQEHIDEANEILKDDIDNYLKNLSDDKRKNYEDINKILGNLKFENNRLKIKDRIITINKIFYDAQKVSITIRDKDKDKYTISTIPVDELGDYVYQYKLKLEKYIKSYEIFKNI